MARKKTTKKEEPPKAPLEDETWEPQVLQVFFEDHTTLWGRISGNFNRRIVSIKDDGLMYVWDVTKGDWAPLRVDQSSIFEEIDEDGIFPKDEE